MARAVFLDRDGVINQPPPDGLYIASPDDLILMPGAADAICRLNQSGFLVIVVTNQRCIGRGIVAAETVEQIHERLQQAAQERGGRIDQIYVCPHDYEDLCSCRKPKPGMLLEAAQEYSLDLDSCWMVGDRLTDVAAGQAAGCRTVLVAGAREVNAHFTASSFAEAVDHILAEASSRQVLD